MAADKENVAAIMKAKQAAGKQVSKSICPRKFTNNYPAEAKKAEAAAKK
jgi:hypothetical protein